MTLTLRNLDIVLCGSTQGLRAVYFGLVIGAGSDLQVLSNVIG